MNRTILPIACVMLAAGTSLAAEARPKFDTKEVVRRVRKAQGTTDSRPASGPACDWGEFLLDTNVVCVPAQGDQDMPAIAFDGTSFFVVWHDERGGSYDIYGARVTTDGAVMDTSGIAVTTVAGDQLYPVVAFDGTSFLVVWEDGRSGSCDIYGSRVSRDGVVLDPSGIAVSTAAYDQWFPAVEFDGTNFLVVWEDGRGGEFDDIYGARVTGAGAVLDPTGIAISRVVYDQMFPAVAFDGANFLVVWEDERNGLGDVYGARVTRAGVVLDTTSIAVSAAPDDQGGPGVAFDGSSFLVIWHDARGGEYYDIYGARVTGAGVVLDPAGIAVSTAPDDQCWPAVAFDGTNFNVVWQDWRGGIAGDIYCARVSEAGVVLDPSGIAVSGTADDQGYPRIAFAGSSFLLVWEDDRDGSYDIYGARVTGAGVVQDTSGIAMSTATNDQWTPVVAYDGTNFFVVWQDGLGISSGIYGARVTPAGTVLDPRGIPVCTTASAQHDPALAFDGTNYLVAWEDSRSGSPFDIYGARVTKAGVVLDTSGIAICAAAGGQWEPAVAFDGTNYLVVWSDLRSGSFDVCGTRVTKAGAVLDPSGIAVSAAANTQWYPAIVFDGTNYLVVWSDLRGGSSYDIYGARVNGAGVVLDPSGFAVCTANNDQQFPVVAFGGTNSLVIWADARSGSCTGIWGARVNGAGVVLDSSGFAVCTVNNAAWYPAVAFDGTNFLVVWTDARTGLETEIYGARVTPGGVVADTFPVIMQDGDQWPGALGVATGGLTFLGYGGWAGTVAGKTYGTYRIWGKLGPFPGVTEGSQSSPWSSRPAPSVVSRVLFLPLPVRGQSLSQPASWLLDAIGRKVADLSPGPNDVSLLPPGVYFVRGNGNAVVQKVIVTH